MNEDGLNSFSEKEQVFIEYLDKIPIEQHGSCFLGLFTGWGMYPLNGLKIPPLSKAIKTRLRPVWDAVKTESDKTRTVATRELERVTTILREQIPNAPAFDVLLGMLPDVLARIEQQLADSGKQAVRKQKPPMSPDPSYGGDTMKTSTTPMAHFWGQALTAGGPNAGRLRNSWVDNQINEHPKFARANMTHGGGEATVYFDPKNYSALEL